MKKILFVIHTLGVGGAEKVLVNLVNNLVDKYDVTVMTIIDTGAFRNHLNDKVHYKSVFSLKPVMSKPNHEQVEAGSLLSNKISFIKKILISIYQVFWKFMPVGLLHKISVREKYDCEVAFLEGITAKFVSGNSDNQTKKIAWIHVDLLNEKKSEKVFLNFNSEKQCYQKFDNIVCVSETVKESFIQKFEFDCNKVLVKYNPIDIAEIEKKANNTCEIMQSDSFNIVSVGRLSKQKGYDRLLRVVKKLNNQNYDFNLYIAGIGPEYEKLNEYKNQNYLDNVYFLGFQSNPYPLMKNADLFVCSSRAEGFSTVVSEASILNTPTITTLCSGMVELFGDSEYGIIVENNENSLYEGLKTILENKETLSQYKSKLHILKDRFDIEKNIKDLEELFDEFD